MERHVPEAFQWWYEDAKADDKRRRDTKPGQEVEFFEGFGVASDRDVADAWEQWLEFVSYVLEDSGGDMEQGERTPSWKPKTTSTESDEDTYG